MFKNHQTKKTNIECIDTSNNNTTGVVDFFKYFLSKCE